MSNIEHVAALTGQAVELLPEEQLKSATNVLYNALYELTEVTDGTDSSGVDYSLAAVHGNVRYAIYHANRALGCLDEGAGKLNTYKDYLLGQSTDGHSGGADTVTSPMLAAQADAPDAAHAPQPVGGVKYVRPEPKHWSELLDYARGLIHPADPTGRTREMTDALMDRLDQLDNEAIDEHRYYGIGLIMCGLARVLHDPAARAERIETAAKSLHSLWHVDGSVERESLQPSDIDSSRISGTYACIVKEQSKALPPEVQLLNDVLHVKQRQRARILKDPDTPPLPQDMNYYKDTSGAVKTGLAAELVGNQAAAAATAIVRVILEKRSEYMADKVPLPLDTNGNAVPRTAVEILDATTPEELNLHLVANRGAALRIDEFSNRIRTYTGTDADGVVTFDGKSVPRSADLPPPAVANGQPAILHARRLRCPALFVGELVPTMVGSVVDIVRRADEIARQPRSPYSY